MLGPVTHMGKNGSDALAGAALGRSRLFALYSVFLFYLSSGNSNETSNYSTANTTIALLVTVPAHAASSALDTLSTQAHGGSRYTTIKDLNRLYSLR